MREKVATAANFGAAALQISGLIGNLCAYGVAVALFSNQTNSQPVVLPEGGVTQQQWRAVVDIEEINTSTAPSLSKSPMAKPREDMGVAKRRAALRADIFEQFPGAVKTRSTALHKCSRGEGA